MFLVFWRCAIRRRPRGSSAVRWPGLECPAQSSKTASIGATLTTDSNKLSPKAFISGITEQDGSYLAEFLHLAVLVARVVGYTGRIVFDPSRPDGTPRKLLDVSRIRALGWHAQIPLEQGIASTYERYMTHASEGVSI
jgi:hypothetical protein